MTTATTTYAPVAPQLTARKGWRSAKNRIATVVLGGCFVVVMVPLVLVLASVVAKGASVFGWRFLTSDIAASERRAEGGIGPAIVGTLGITVLATAMAVPLGVLGAIYLHEYGDRSVLARLTRFMSNVMTGVPSIVMGLFIYVVWTLRFGLSGLGGALALACLMLPIIIRSTDEMLRLVPNELREASLGLGARKGRTILTVVLPAALPGIVSGVLLSVARAAGETAPLLFTIGASKSLHANPLSGATNSLPLQIFSNAISAYQPAQNRAWGAALTLIVITFLFTIIARVCSARFALKR